MRLQIPNFRLCVFVLASLILLAGVGNAQEKPKSASSETPISRPQVLAAKKQTTPPASNDNRDDLHRAPATEADKDSAEQIRKRDEWFYRQRSSVNGRIPAGARFKAFRHMQRMMEAEGKLVLRPDHSYAEAAPQSWLSPQGAVTSTWASIGPAPTTGGFFSPVTGRVMTIAVDPSDTTGNTVLIGGAMGGIWRSTDAGVTWTPVGDQNPSLAMGSIAFAPSNQSVVYAGTGESSLGFDTYYGAGVLKSTDHGLTWTQTCTVAGPTCPFIGPFTDGSEFGPGFGFLNFGGAHISYIAVNPVNSNMVLVGAHFIEEGPKEGVYCSDDGGSTWTNILPDQMSTFVGFASSAVAYAAFGNLFGSSAGAPNGNGIYKATAISSACSTIHFARLTSATLPLQSSMGRIDLGIASSVTSGNTVYASIADASLDSTTGFSRGSRTNLGVFLTTNGGTSWVQTTAPDVCQFQCWYDNVIKVDPNNKNIAFFGGGAVRDSSGNFSWVVRTQDGGITWSSVIPNLPGGSAGLPHVDNHAIAFVKLSTGKVRMYLGNDGGVWRTDDAEASTVTWTNLNNPSLTLTQFYPSMSFSPSSPTIAFGGTQDNGSQNYQGGTSWVDNQLCGDGASSAVDSVIPSTVYIGCGTGAPVNASYQNGAIGTFSPAVNGINLSDFSSFIPPLVTDPNAANVLYFGTTKIYQSLDAGNNWTPISFDLANGSSGDWLNTVAVMPGNSSVVYAGLNNGQVFFGNNVAIRQSGFANFTAVNNGLPPRAVTAISIEPSDPSGKTAYVAFSAFSFVGTDPFGISINDPRGHIFKTVDNGNTWTDLSCSTTNCSTPGASDLPNIPVNDLVLDPDVPNTLYAATDLGVFVGDCSAMPCTWTTVGSGLPRVAVISLRLHQASRTLRAATHGRGAWEIDLNNFSFSGPHISSVSPTSVSANGAQFALTVNGSSLTGGTIQFGNTALVPTGTQSDASLSGTVPTSLLTAGTVQITVKTSSATSNSLPFAIMALTPTLTSLNPASTAVQTPTPTTNVAMQLTGTDFSTNAKVLFNGAQNGIPTTFNSSTSLTATLPAALLGPFGSTNDISVLNTPPGGGQSKRVTFKVAAPPPRNDTFANAINITAFTFTDVQDSSGATTESTDPTPPCATQFTSAQGNTAGHPNGVYNTIWYNFTPIVSANLNVDTIQSYYDTVLSIWTGPAGSLVNAACNDDWNPGVTGTSQLLNVALTAGTTYFIMVSSFGPPDANPVALGGGTFFHFSFNGGLSPAPTITSISPTSSNSGDPTFTLTVNGSNFLNGAIVDFNAQFTGTALATTFVSSTQLTAIVPASTIALPGPFTVNVLNPLPTVGPSNFVNFTVNLGVYPVPTLTSIYPTTIIAGSLPFSINASGTNFAPGAVINFNGVAKATTLNSPQNAFATISTADISTAGTVQVTVSNPTPGGGPSAPQSFIISQPTVVPSITSVNPATVPAGIPTNFTINGTGFTPGAALDVVGTGGGYYSTNFISSTQLSIPSFAVGGVGTFPVYVVDAAPAGTSTAFNLTVTQPPPPTITSISPTTAQTGSSPTLTITGTNFQPGASVMFNSSSFPANFTSSTQLMAAISLGGVAAGTYPLSVVNPVPSATTSAPFNFIVTGPPDFSITSSGSTSQTVTAGQTATFTNAISVTAQSGFSAQLNLSCSLPIAATATTCSVNPASIPSGSGTATVTVSTMVRGLVPPLWPRVRFIFWPQFLPLFLLTVLLSALLLRLARTRRQRFAGALPLAILVLLVTMGAIGCGSGGYAPPPPPPPTGTPAGTYTVTVTATSGTLTHTTTLTVVVQ